ncbi:MAG: helix-turn-helix transcriptional regulator [Armatimonadota bacterium]|nr:helix-turn-helix transcriptional regulator [Armatimonadota bacterium]
MTPSTPNRKVHNRIKAVMEHVPWYGFKSQARLAEDLGFSKSAVSRLLRAECSPTLALAYAVTETLEKRLGQQLDPRELFSVDGTYPTASACQLVGCRNCLPAEAYDRDDNIRPEFSGVKAGQWSLPVPNSLAAHMKQPNPVGTDRATEGVQ